MVVAFVNSFSCNEVLCLEMLSAGIGNSQRIGYGRLTDPLRKEGVPTKHRRFDGIGNRPRRAVRQSDSQRILEVGVLQVILVQHRNSKFLIFTAPNATDPDLLI